MNFNDDDDSCVDQMLDGPLLDLPDDFAARVMAALPARPGRFEAPRRAPRAWRVLQAAVMAACGSLGALEVLLFVCGLWTATAVAVG
jgi:alpha-D-ribose 1-methylphosphonate 5-triphosphate synthase subunit PhnH